ncbi:UNVERIFIED_CONTAM: hypothetical protein HDU68_010955 [Siphonaria sp. JEL0065]|nr:hypothetical protein HDU68_010955 [Siphonaria sp. JEL0065]
MSYNQPPQPPNYAVFGEPAVPPPSGAFPPPPTPVVNNEDAPEILLAVMKFPTSWLSRCVDLRYVLQYDLIVIADDSGSMQSRSTTGFNNDPFGRAVTRWDELKSTVSLVTEIGAVLDDDGVDVYFLNRAPVRNIKGPSAELNAAFANPPMGYTPTARVLRQVLREKGLGQGENSKKLLILIATDGQPTTDQGQIDKYGLEQVLRYERGPNPSSGNVIVVFLACTDDESDVGYLNEWDKRIPAIDVVDDYYSERKEILAVQGSQFPFSRGDWVCKMLLGALDPEIDGLDERRVGSTNNLAIPPSGNLGRRPSTKSNSGGNKECIVM